MTERPCPKRHISANSRRNHHGLRDQKATRDRFIAEFLRRLREAPPGTRVYMRVGDVFKDADVVSIDELRAARAAALLRDDDDNEGEEPRP